MLASTEYKYVFLSNPKTATSAFETAFRPFSNFVFKRSRAHIGYADFKKIFGNYFEDQGCQYYVVVRDPLDRLLSWYRFRNRDSLKSADGSRGRNYAGDMTFEDYARREDKRQAHMMQVVVDENGDLAPLNYYRYAQISKMTEKFSELVGQDVELPTVNPSPKVPVEFDQDYVMNLPVMQRSYEIFNKIVFVEPE